MLRSRGHACCGGKKVTFGYEIAPSAGQDSRGLRFFSQYIAQRACQSVQTDGREYVWGICMCFVVERPHSDAMLVTEGVSGVIMMSGQFRLVFGLWANTRAGSMAQYTNELG